MSWTGVLSSAHRVTAEIRGAHPRHPEYPLLPGDILLERRDGSFGKFGPGLGIEGFELTADQRTTLEEIHDQAFVMNG